GDRVVKCRILLCASLATFALLASRPALTQALPPYHGTAYPGEGALPPHEAVTIVSSTGLEPVGRPAGSGAGRPPGTPRSGLRGARGRSRRRGSSRHRRCLPRPHRQSHSAE